MKDNLKKKMEDDLKQKWKTNQSTKINLIGCDTIVNSPSFLCCYFSLRRGSDILHNDNNNDLFPIQFIIKILQT